MSYPISPNYSSYAYTPPNPYRVPIVPPPVGYSSGSINSFHQPARPLSSPSPPPPPPLDVGRGDTSSDLFALSFQKELAYAPSHLMQTYNDALDYIQQVFPTLATMPRSAFMLYVIDADSALIRVPAAAWTAVLPTLTTYQFSPSSTRFIFVEVDGYPSGLPTWPFSVEKWFVPKFDPMVPMPPNWTGVDVGTGSSDDGGSDTPTVRPPPPPFSVVDAMAGPPPPEKRSPEPVPKKSFWAKVRRFFGGGGSAGKKDA